MLAKPATGTVTSIRPHELPAMESSSRVGDRRRAKQYPFPLAKFAQVTLRKMLSAGWDVRKCTGVNQVFTLSRVLRWRPRPCVSSLPRYPMAASSSQQVGIQPIVLSRNSRVANTWGAMAATAAIHLAVRQAWAHAPAAMDKAVDGFLKAAPLDAPYAIIRRSTRMARPPAPIPSSLCSTRQTRGLSTVVQRPAQTRTRIATILGERPAMRP